MKNKSNVSKLPEVRVVEASAGSGKTYALSKRYLQLILNKEASPELIRDILAITFTNAAAREMKENILDFLKRIALDSFSNLEKKQDIYSCLKITPQIARQKATDLMNYIIQNYNFFQIQTIDSFINILLAGCSYKLDISAQFKIKENYKDYLSYSLDECIQEANYSKKVKNVFDNFINQYLFLENKHSWFPKDNILGLIYSLFHYNTVYGRNFFKFGFEKQSLFAKKNEILNSIKVLKDKAPEGTNKRFLNSINKFLEKNQKIFDFEDLSDYFKREVFPINKGYEVPNEIKKTWGSVRKKIKETSKKEALSLFNCYIDIFNMVHQFFKKTTAGEDIIFLGELNREARMLFENSGITVPELYYRLAARFKHYLIDEFQDTSLLQWQNLKLMIEDALSSGGSLFYVGDKKQAIYRFRGGEVSLFDDIKEELFNFNIRTSSLNKNYRSQKAIVDFNNKLFSKSNLAEFIQKFQSSDNNDLGYFSKEDADEIIDSFAESEQIYKKDKQNGYVNVQQIECNNKEERNEIVKNRLFDRVKELRKRFSLKDIAVLLRSNKDVELISGWLIEQGIPVESDKTLNIKNNKFIKEIVSFLKFLNSPIDNISFVSFIYSDIFSKVSGLDRKEIEEFLIKQRDNYIHKSTFYIYREFRENYQKIWKDYIEDFFKNVGLIGFYELVIDIFQQMQIFKNFPEYQGFFMHFLEMIKTKEEDYQNLDDFLGYFENADETDQAFYVNSSATDAIKVKTIHKAKGLGFPVVILPFLELNKLQLSPGGRGKSSYIVKEFEDNLVLLRLDKKYAKFSSFIKDFYIDEYKKSFIDELNTIYVAFTRAKYEMHIFIPVGINHRKNLVKFLVPENIYECGKPRLYKELNNKEEHKNIEIPVVDYKNWISFLKNEFVDINTIKNREEILKGSILHFILSCIGNLKNKSKEEILKKATKKANTEFPDTKNFSGEKSMVNALLKDDVLKRFFYLDKNDSVFTEKELVDKKGHTKRIDRLIIKADENEVWVIDYKLKGALLKEYKDQIIEYIDLVKQIYPEFKIKGFIIFIQELQVEEING